MITGVYDKQNIAQSMSLELIVTYIYTEIYSNSTLPLIMLLHLFSMVQNPRQQQTFQDSWQIEKFDWSNFPDTSLSQIYNSSNHRSNIVIIRIAQNPNFCFVFVAHLIVLADKSFNNKPLLNGMQIDFLLQ